MNEVAIIKINDSETKSLIAAEILEDLPQWFGLPERTKEYIEEVYHLPMWAAFDKNHAVGFITLKESSQYTAEIHCMGVKRVIPKSWDRTSSVTRIGA